MRIAADNGRILDAAVEISSNGDSATILFESRGPERNTEYIPAFELVFNRLSRISAIIESAFVVSAVTQQLDAEARRLNPQEMPLPRLIANADDAEHLSRLLRSEAARVGRDPGARGAGNPTKRVELHFSVPGLSSRPAAWLEEQVVAPPEAADVFAVEQVARPRRVASGQGFGLTTEARKAVEVHAMRVAGDYLKEHWSRVSDVSTREPYDLLCRSGDSELRVEVKGTTGLGGSVVLTRNEVAHARAHYPRIALYVVYGINLSSAGGTPSASGGTLRRIEPWNVEDFELETIAFQCFL